jgi:RNA polymerase sigma factor (sigma-70 family)
MLAISELPAAERTLLCKEEMWEELRRFLRPYAWRLVRAADVESWRGQRADLVEDIVQETVRRIVERARRAEAGELPPIASLKGFATITARHYCVDLQRRDSRLRREVSTSATHAEYGSAALEQMSPPDLAIERLSQEELFARLARCIARFPAKQRKALLTDLANCMQFEEEPSALQKAFLAQGIDLRTYQQSLPDDPVARARYAALVYVAYKRVARCMRDETEYRC